MYIKGQFRYELEEKFARREFIYNNTVTAEQLENIIVSAFEGGVNYWCVVDNSTDDFKKLPNDMPISQKIFKIIMDGRNVSLYDIEEEEESIWDLTFTRLLRGIELNSKNRPFDCDLENIDATTADCIIQYSIYDDIIFG